MDSGYDERGSQARAGVAMSDRRNTYFLSDAHLGASYIADARAHEATLVSFLQSIEPTAKTVYLLGDILDYWFEYRTVVPRGYVRFFGQLARMADAGIRIVWFTGNHDIWLFDYLRDELGIEIADPSGGGMTVDIDGTRFFLGHGDDLGRQPRGYRLLRATFRCRFLQKLYSGIHPRWTIPFAHGWSSHSRKAGPPEPRLDGAARAALELACRELAAADPMLRYIVIGHHHVAVDEPVTANCRLVVLGEWISACTYAVFDGTSMSLAKFTSSSAE